MQAKATSLQPVLHSKECQLIFIHFLLLFLTEPPFHNVFTGLPLMIWLPVVLSGFEHLFKSAKVCLLIFGLPGKLKTHLSRACQGTADTADAVEAFIVKAAVWDIPGIQIFPNILAGPVNNGIQGMHGLHGTGLEHPPGFIVVVHELDIMPGIVVQFQQSTVVLPFRTFLPADTGNSDPSPASAFLQLVTAVAHLPGGRHSLFHDELPHGDIRLVHDDIRVMLPDKINSFRRVHRCQTVMGIEADASLFA